jgi:molybdopterin converting factor small subunit
MTIRVVFSGRRYDAAQSLPEEISLPDGATVEDALKTLSDLLPVRLPESCLVAVSGVHLGTVARHRSRDLRQGDEIVLIAPVAGG